MVRRSTIEGILSDARETLDATLPIPELMEMEDLLRATVQATLDLLDNAATQVTEGEGSKVRRHKACQAGPPGAAVRAWRSRCWAFAERGKLPSR